MHSAGLSIPNPMSWLLAMAPDGKRDSLEAWSTWLKCFVLLTNVEWSESARKDALDAYEAGRTARVPCGPPPTTLCQKSAVLGWFEWSAQGSSTRFEDHSWKSHTFEWTHQVAESLGLSGSWRHPHIEAASMAHFLMMRLDLLHRSDAPTLPSETFGGKESTHAERQKQIWRECVRIRQYLADLLPLAQDLPRSSRNAFKTWWFASLEWTRLAEQAGVGLWESPVSFTATSRIHIKWQRWFGKLAFR